MNPELEEARIYAQAQQQAQQQAQDNDPNAMYADYMRENKVNNIIQQINPDNLVEDIEHRIRGQKKNKYTEEWEDISPTHKMVVSELMITRYVSFLSSILNQNTSLSNYSNQEINNLMTMVVDYIRDDLSDNAEEYGFNFNDKYGNEFINYNEMNRIGMIVCGTTFAVFKRALNGMEARRIFSSLKVSESLNAGEQKKGFWDSLKFWR